MPTPTTRTCLVCGSGDWTPLTDVGPASMASDCRVIQRPLRKHACNSCGLVATDDGGVVDATLFEDGYRLYAHAPGAREEERARQAQYAAWIQRLSPAAPPRLVLDAGCGNGSLLRALGDRWPSTTFTGCDPSAESVACGRADGLDVWQGTAETLPPGLGADLVISVNVIEHTRDPERFLHALRLGLAPAGRLVLICPDGSTPGVELLIADHHFSFAARHLDVLLARAGLKVDLIDAAPPGLGAFQMALAHAGAGRPAVWNGDPGATIRAKDAYLQRWSCLDRRLSSRVGGQAICFGIGETAGLLRAYTPGMWQRIRACTADGIAGPRRFGPLPVVPLDRVSPEETVVVAVRPHDQTRVADRLRERFPRVVVWHDLVDGSPP